MEIKNKISQTEEYESLKYFNETHILKIQDFVNERLWKDDLIFKKLRFFLDSIIDYINKKEVTTEKWVENIKFISEEDFRKNTLIWIFVFFSPLDVFDKNWLWFNLFSFFVEILKKYNYNLSKNDDIKDKIYLELLEHDKKILDDKKLINQIYWIKEEVTEILEK